MPIVTRSPATSDGDVADYLSKTPALITAALRRLGSHQMLEFETTNTNDDTPIPPIVRVFPTASALRTQPAFAELDAEQMQDELEALHV